MRPPHRHIFIYHLYSYAQVTSSCFGFLVGAGGGEVNGEFWISKASIGGSILQTILSIFPLYVLFRSSKKKHTRLKLLFHVKRRSARGRRKGDRPAGRRLKTASTAERQGGGWCCTVCCALPCSVLSNCNRRGKEECIEVMH